MGDVLQANSDGSVRNANTGEVLIPATKPQTTEQPRPALTFQGFRPGKLTIRTGQDGTAVIDQGTGPVQARDILPRSSDPLDNARRSGMPIARHLLKDTDIVPDPQLGGDMRIREGVTRGLVRPLPGGG